MAPQPSSNQQQQQPSLSNTIIKDRWSMTTLLGSGAFGQVYKAWDSELSKYVAIKVESPLVRKPVLKLESQILRRLGESPPILSKYSADFIAVGRFIAPHLQQAQNIPGQESSGIYTYLIMSLLSSSISELRKKQPNGSFSLNTTAMLGVQMVRGIRAVHEIGIVHRDIKPANFCVEDLGEGRCVLIDFGLSRKYIGSDGGIRAERENVGFRGTARYASINAHFGKELGRVDDLWSLFYMTVEFLVGTLPWKGKEKDRIGDLKVAHTNDQLVQGLPVEMSHYLHYLQSLSYESDPDYDYLESLNMEMVGYGRKNLEDSDDFCSKWSYDWQSPDCDTEMSPIITHAASSRMVSNDTTQVHKSVSFSARAAEPVHYENGHGEVEQRQPVPPAAAMGGFSRPRRFIRQLFKK